MAVGLARGSPEFAHIARGAPFFIEEGNGSNDFGAELGEDDKVNVPAVIIILQLCYPVLRPPRARLKLSREIQTHVAASDFVPVLLIFAENLL